jgi:hypothetical protein
MMERFRFLRFDFHYCYLCLSRHYNMHQIGSSDISNVSDCLIVPYAPINVMPDPREGGDTQGIVLISLLLGRGFYFI